MVLKKVKGCVDVGSFVLRVIDAPSNLMNTDTLPITPTAKKLVLGETVRTPRGLIIVVNTFNILPLQRSCDNGWMEPKRTRPVQVGPRRAKG